jgi:hypothetical protein
MEVAWPGLSLRSELLRRDLAHDRLARLCLGYFARQVRTIRGRPFSFEGHEYLRELYEEHHPHVVVEKAAQMGASEFAISKALHVCLSRPGTCVIIFFPTDQDVRDFSKHRVSPALDDLRASGLLPERSGGRSATDNVGLREIGQSALYFRGMQSGIRMKSIPADMLVLDELDESPPEFKPLARERLSHSPLKWVVELSTPTLPDYGIDVEFQRSDQRYWHVACGCSDGVVLEHAFPECLARRADGSVHLVCPACGEGPLDPCRGRWIAHEPSRGERRGYHLSQLFSTAITPREVLEEYEHTRNLAEFHNSKLGIPYAGDRMPLVRTDLLCLLGEHELGDPPDAPCTMGVDQGTRLHVVVASGPPARRRLLEVAVVDSFEAVGGLIERYRVQRCVIDGLPNQHSARSLAKAFAGRVHLAYYSEGKREEPEITASRETVAVDRTEALDRMVATVKAGEVVLPRRLTPQVEEFIRQLCAIAKVLQEDERTGRQVARYIRTGPDHFAHALAYECLAADRLRTTPVVAARAGRGR